jgi:hypothetical protein
LAPLRHELGVSERRETEPLLSQTADGGTRPHFRIAVQVRRSADAAVAHCVGKVVRVCAGSWCLGALLSYWQRGVKCCFSNSSRCHQTSGSLRRLCKLSGPPSKRLIFTSEVSFSQVHDSSNPYELSRANTPGQPCGCCCARDPGRRRRRLSPAPPRRQQRRRRRWRPPSPLQ